MSGVDWVEVLGIILLLLAVALMAASETAITRTNRVHAYHLAEEGRRGASSLQRITENPPPYLNVVLLLTLLCTIGGLLGLAVGYACARVVPSALGWPTEFNERMALIAIACSSLIGIIFGLLPAQRAARLDPAALLRSG